MFVASGIKIYATLQAKEAREQWEKHFNEAYIHPTLRVSRQKFQTCILLIVLLFYCFIATGTLNARSNRLCPQGYQRRYP